MDSWSVLLVDDDPQCRSALGALLRGRGYEVEEVAHGQEALDWLLARGASIVITDLAMPVMDGWALVREMKDSAALTVIPVIALSASPPGDIAADACMMKPIRLMELLETVERLLLEAASRDRPATTVAAPARLPSEIGVRD